MSLELGKIKVKERADLHLTAFYGGVERGSCIELAHAHMLGEVNNVIQLDKDAARKLAKELQSWLGDDVAAPDEEAADKVENLKVGIAATFDSIEQVVEQYNVKGTDLAVLLIAVNTTLQLAANKLRGGE